MKTIIWETPDRMAIDTGHKTFDRQTNLITYGNTIANTMVGWHIRAWNDEWHWQEGMKHKPGYLYAFDVGYLKRRFRLSFRVWNRIKELAMHDPLWVYVFFHYWGAQRTVHGVVVTSKDHQLLETFITGPTYKSRGVVETSREYVTNMAVSRG